MTLVSRCQLRLAVPVFAAVSVLATALFWPVIAGAQSVALVDIAARDQLISDQEALLNVYRCRFDIDTLIVRGGCVDGQPARQATLTDPFGGTPNANEIYVRDSLIASQESLLNAYRCRFDIDTQIVPNGCANGQPVESDTVPIQTTESTIVASGWDHSCAIKADGSIVCWGNNGHGQSDAPPGQYTAIDTGGIYSCAIRIDSTITCWGYNGDGQTDAPSGQYTAISAGNGSSCAIRVDNTIACWGRNDSRQADPPSGQYVAVEAGTWSSCAIRVDNTLTCWGWSDRAQPFGPKDKFTAIAAGFGHWCAIRADTTIANIVCWGNNDSGQADPPSGQYTAISAGNYHSCAIRADRTIACWGSSTD
ncbi:MAG: hypothetical protein F4015_06450, partial [Acidimicrobiia bacterium]|nr:hypothetical protein [Acidimicrobiia bacterium]